GEHPVLRGSVEPAHGLHVVCVVPGAVHQEDGAERHAGLVAHPTEGHVGPVGHIAEALVVHHRTMHGEADAVDHGAFTAHMHLFHRPCHGPPRLAVQIGRTGAVPPGDVVPVAGVARGVRHAPCRMLIVAHHHAGTAGQGEAE